MAVLTAIVSALLFIAFVIAQSLYSTIIEHLSNKAFAEKHGCLPPHRVPGHWFLGYDNMVKIFEAMNAKRLLPYFHELVKREGETFDWVMFGFRGLGTQDPRNIKAILKDQVDCFSHESRRIIMGELLGDGIFTQDGHAWKESKDSIRPLLSWKRYQDYRLFEEHLESLFRHISSNEIIDLQPLFSELTMNVSLALLCGIPFENFRGEFSSVIGAFSAAEKIASAGVMRRAKLGPLARLYYSPQYSKACRTLRDSLDLIIAESVRKSGTLDLDVTESDQSGTGSTIAELMRRAKHPGQVRDQVLHILVAGRDTTASVLSWTMRILTRYTEVQKRVREEIKEVLAGSGNSLPKKEDIAKMNYLSCVLKEVMRLYPPLAMNSRTATRTVALPKGGGPDGEAPLLVRKGEDIGFCTYSLHRRKDVFGEDADDFVPERWMGPTAGAARDSWAYIPFHAGPRLCPGRGFALAQVSYVIVRLLQEYPILSLPPGEFVEAPGYERQAADLILFSADGCRVVVK